MGEFYLVGCKITLAASRPLVPDDVTKLVAVIIDELDELSSSPDVSATGSGSEVELTIEVLVPINGRTDHSELFFEGATCIRSALHAAEVATAGMVVPTAFESRGELLQDA